MELHDIRTFIEVAKHPSFRDAAKELACSQGAVTKTIARLEEELGPILFERNRSGARLTSAGRDFLKHALQMARLEEAALKDMNKHDGTGVRLRVGHSPSQRELVVACLAQLLRDVKGLRVTVDEALSVHIEERVEQGELDIAIIHKRSSPEEVGFLRLMDTNLRLAVHPEHRLAKSPAVDLEGLKQERFVLTRGGGRSRQIVDNYFAEHGFVPKIAFEASTMTVLMAVRTSREFVTVLPSSSPRVASTHGVAFIDLAPACRAETSFLIWNGTDRPGPSSEQAWRFRQTLIALLGIDPKTTS